MDVNSQQKLLDEIFASIDIIAKKRIEETSFTQTISGRIIEKIPSSDMYRIQYQNEEIRAMAMGGTNYAQGDTVYILVPDKRLDNLKFILGKTNERTATATGSQLGGLSADILAEIQEIITAVDVILSDKMIIPSEKVELEAIWENIGLAYHSIRNQAVLHGVPITDIEASYVALGDFLDIIFEEMNVVTLEEDLIVEHSLTFTDLKETFAAYFGEEQGTRIDILEKLASYKQYQASITSSNGNLFVNGSVDTLLNISVYRGVENVTLSLPNSAFKWRKLDQTGNEDTGWGFKNGAQLHITNADIQTKATFVCEITVEGARVATSQVTLVDFSDAKSLQLFVETNHPSIQIYNTSTSSYNPDWQNNHLIMTLSAYASNSNVDVASELINVVWKKDGTVLTADANHEFLPNGSLKVKGNVLAGAQFTRYEVSAEYMDGTVAISDSVMVEFAKIEISTTDQEISPVSFAYMVHPDGTVFRNPLPTDTKRIQVVYMEGENLITSNLTYKWFYADPNVVSGDPNYDAEGGDGWSLISETNNMNGSYLGYTSNNLTVKAKGIDGSETFKVSVRLGSKNPIISITTLVDITDPHQIIIEGDSVFKNGNGTLNLRARVLLNGTEITDLAAYTFLWRAYSSDGTLVPSWSANTQMISVNHNDVPEKGYFTCDVSLT